MCGRLLLTPACCFGTLALLALHNAAAAAEPHRSPGTSAEIGEIGLQDIRECLNAHRRADGEYIVFLEDDYKSKVVMYRFK